MKTDRDGLTILFFAIISMMVFTFSLGLLIPLVAFRMEAQGYSYTDITLVTMASLSGVMAAGPLMSVLNRFLPTWGLLAISFAACAFLALFLELTEGLPAWMIIRFLQGLTIACIFVVSETWINQVTTKSTRGAIMGLYISLTAGGFALGPLILVWLGVDTAAPVIVFMLFLLSPLPLLIALRRRLPDFTSPGARINQWRVIKAAPLIFLLAFTASYFDSTAYTLLGPYALRMGYSQEVSAYLITWLFAGNALLQIPIGLMVNLCPRRLLVFVMAFYALITGLFLPEILTLKDWRWPLVLLWGGLGYGIFTVALIEVGDHFKGVSLMQVNTVLATMWGASGVFSALSGFMSDLLPVRGLGLAMSLPFLFIVILIPFLPFVRQPDLGR